MSNILDTRIRTVRGPGPTHRLIRVYAVDDKTGAKVDLPVSEVQRTDSAQGASMVTITMLAARVQELTEDQQAVLGYE